MGALMVSGSTLGEDVVFAHRLDASLRTVGQSRWAAGGAVQGPVHVLASGEVVALVQDARRLHLVRWTVDGRELLRRPVTLGGKVRASRPFAGGLVVVTEDAVARVELADGRVSARVPWAVAPDAWAEASPGGAWFATRDRLVFVGLDGQRMTRNLPLAVPAEPANGISGMAATDRDECILAERRTTLHEVSGRDGKPDRTFVLVLTRIDRRGEVVARAEMGNERTRWEWFWIEGSTAGFLPRGAGIVRTRYHGGIEVSGWSADAGGSALVTMEDVGPGDSRDRIVRLDPGLHEAWSAPYGAGALTWCAAPFVANGVFVRSGPAQVRFFGDGGRQELVSFLPYPRGVEPAPLAGAVGRDDGGHWIVVTYGARGATP
jgi:hypothetical protein